ncbi:MAG: Gfo/Idh/MocA family oxidoreductase [Pseudomonadota bacterium]
MAPNPIRLLILGTGDWASAHAFAFAAMDNVQLVGAVDTNEERLWAFCRTHEIDSSFAQLDDALAWGQFDAATNVTADAAHFPTTMKLLAAGKHVLCEKPLALNHADAQAMVTAAEEAGVVNMINLTYRAQPAMQKAAEMVRAGKIGRIRHFEASYLQSWLVQPAWGEWSQEHRWLWRLSTKHGSKGVLGDIGIHILDFATHIANDAVASVSARLKTFDKAPDNRIGEFELDANDSCFMTLEMAGGASGHVHASRFATGHLNDLHMRIHGDDGALDVWSIQHKSTLRACLRPNLEDARWEDVPLPESCPKVFQLFIDAIAGKGPTDPNFAHGAALQRIMDLAVESDAVGGVTKEIVV